ncbi:hypothetical protein BDW22DRAFT_1432006 [Trametopsis cervina]|nr:hypothetical protein BDW22DRAFT_1432006 [Trametopsis cervina]
MPSRLPPDASGSVLAISGSSVIDAPIDTVWDVLLDFPAYHEWNPFVREQTVVTPASRPHASQVPHEGSYLTLRVHLPPSFDAPRGFSLLSPSTTHLVIAVLEPENYRAAWTNRMPQWLMTTERWQWLTVVEGEEGGERRTKYESIEVFNGPAAWFVRWFVAPYLRVAFKAMADGLKARAEEKARLNASGSSA